MAVKRVPTIITSNYANLRKAGYGPKRAMEVAQRHAAQAEPDVAAPTHTQGNQPVEIQTGPSGHLNPALVKK